MVLSGFFVQTRWWIKVISLIFILPWAVPSIPTILSVRFMLNPEWGVINSLIFRWTGLDGPNWLNDPTIGLTMAIAVHIWKSLPFWTLILIAARLASPLPANGGREHWMRAALSYEGGAVVAQCLAEDGADVLVRIHVQRQVFGFNEERIKGVEHTLARDVLQRGGSVVSRVDDYL